VSYVYDRRKVAEAGLESLVSDYILSIADKIGHGIATATHAHIDMRARDVGHHRTEVQVIARAGDLLHQFHVAVSFDSAMQVSAELEYSSLSPDGQQGRQQTRSFAISPNSPPEHLVSQVVRAALELFHGKPARPEIELRQAGRVS
jgi:hypothetical protein